MINFVPGGLFGLAFASLAEVLLGGFYGYYGVFEVIDTVEAPHPASIIHAGIQIILALSFISGGIGLFLLKEWGRKLNLVVAVIVGLYALLSLVVVLLALPAGAMGRFAPFLALKGAFVVLTAILFYYLMRPAVKGAFSSPQK